MISAGIDDQHGNSFGNPLQKTGPMPKIYIATPTGGRTTQQRKKLALAATVTPRGGDIQVNFEKVAWAFERNRGPCDIGPAL